MGEPVGGESPVVSRLKSDSESIYSKVSNRNRYLIVKKSLMKKFIFVKNQCRKESDSTYNDAEIERRISRTRSRLASLQSRSMPDPPLSDIDFKTKIALV